MTAFEDNFADWLIDTITVESWTGSFNAEGQPNRAAPVTLKARIESNVRKVNDSTGIERVSNTTVYVAKPLDLHDRITMPAGFQGPSKPPIINVANLNDIASYDHSEVYL